ncbi:MAG: histidinol-phosphate transaminase [Spirochaetaceae bacterium]|nr:histidinol-phosphate transaminase [Spirochaetaceae bacterium]
MERTMIRKDLEGLKPYVPGKPIEEARREYGLSRVEKLASNENPLGPSPAALAAMRDALASANFYPDPTARALREALAAANGLEPDRILVGNGGEHLLSVIAQALVDRGDAAAMAETTFGVYASSVSIMGGRAVRVAPAGCSHDGPGLAAAGRDAKLVYVCNPNNPTGDIMPRREVELLADALPRDAVLVLDEAYYEYARSDPDYHDGVAVLKSRPNTVVLRTFSKFAGLAGMRIAYVMSSPELIGAFAKVRGVFSANSVAQAGALAALGDAEHTARTLELNAESMKAMTAAFRERGLAYVESRANFVFVDTGVDSMAVYELLMRRGVLVRPGALWGKKTWLRVSTGTMEQTGFFLKALDEAVAAAR